MTFNPIENRDAWATIRGFVYQVQLTLLHWLQLDDDQVLELEKGEDIDIVTQAINKQEVDRILGQSKYREKGVSLGQNEVIEILLNYFIHRKNNPENRLKFLYISNSESVLEKPAIFLDGKKGIEVWTELRNSNISLTDPAFIKIKNHLISKVDLIIEELEGFKNSKQKLIEWKEFKDFIGEDNQLLNFIEGFEWSLGNGDPDQLKEKIDKLILTKSSVDPSQLYSRLFLHVFELLSEKGEKTLTKSQFFQLTNLPELTSNQSKWLEILEELLSSINKRVEGLEKQVRINSEKIGSILSNKTTEGTADLEFSYQLKALTINAPATVNNGSLREKKVGVLQEHLKIKAWVAI